MEGVILEGATQALIQGQRLAKRGMRFHIPSHTIQISERDRQLWERAKPKLAPSGGSPLSLHQAAEELGVDKKILETSLKNAVKVGEMVLVAKNRFVPARYVASQGSCGRSPRRAECRRQVSTVAQYRDQTKIGRNFAIDLLEYFDRLGFTERVGNNRRIKRPARTVFAVEENA